MAETPTPEPTSEPTPVITTRQVVIPAPSFWDTPYYPVGVYFVRQEGARTQDRDAHRRRGHPRCHHLKIPVMTIQSRGISTWKVQTIAHATTRTATKTLYKGVEKVKVAGVAGQRKVLVDPANKVWKTVPVTSPVTKQVLVGTYVAPAWLHPVGTNGSPTSPVGYRIHPITKTRKFHGGMDIGNQCGVPVRATRAGTVTASTSGGASGNAITINHGRYGTIANVTTKYLHLSKHSVSVGTKVAQGQIIGYEGTTGSSTMCYLHFRGARERQPRRRIEVHRGHLPTLARSARRSCPAEPRSADADS